MTDNLNKKDLDLILEVNRKAIELETERVEIEHERIEQNERIIKILNTIQDDQVTLKESVEESIEENKTFTKTLDKKLTDLERDLYKIQVLFLSGAISLILQIIQLFAKR